MMAYTCFEIELHNHIAHVRFCRPDKRNSMIPEFWNELPRLMEELDHSGEIRVVVLSSTGPHFTSGMDLSVFTNSASVSDENKSTQHNAAMFYDTVRRLQESFSSLEKLRVPVLAAVQGGCIGAGVDLVSACDMRYACDGAFFSIQETNIGMTADVGTFPRLTKLMPDGIVREMAYTGRSLSADEAITHGLINAKFDTADEMLSHVMQIAKTIAEKAPFAIHGCKKMILHSRDHTVSDTLDYVGLWNACFLNTADLMESMQASREKRPPNYNALPKKALSNDDTDIQLP